MLFHAFIVGLLVLAIGKRSVEPEEVRDLLKARRSDPAKGDRSVESDSPEVGDPPASSTSVGATSLHDQSEWESPEEYRLRCRTLCYPTGQAKDCSMEEKLPFERGFVSRNITGGYEDLFCRESCEVWHEDPAICVPKMPLGRPWTQQEALITDPYVTKHPLAKRYPAIGTPPLEGETDESPDVEADADETQEKEAGKSHHQPMISTPPRRKRNKKNPTSAEADTEKPIAETDLENPRDVEGDMEKPGTEMPEVSDTSTTTTLQNIRKPMNAAFVFIKPHAVTEKVKNLAKRGLQRKGIKILAEGSLTGKTIDEKKLIDQHYYAIASKATILKPSELNVPVDKFHAQFGISWQAALASGKVFNAMDGCKYLGIDAKQMDAAWAKTKEAKKLVKFGGGFYCGLVEVAGHEPVYIFNGFFMAMRSKFTAPDTEIYWYSVEWDPAALSWADFRGKVLGPTDPAEAPKDSLRGQILAKWKNLGLKSPPNVGDNGMHASASPFEAFAERNNWLGMPIKEDPFGKMMLDAGMSEKRIKEWSVDPQVNIKGGKFGSIFDQLEDMDAESCLRKLVELSVSTPPRRKRNKKNPTSAEADTEKPIAETDVENPRGVEGDMEKPGTEMPEVSDTSTTTTLQSIHTEPMVSTPPRRKRKKEKSTLVGADIVSQQLKFNYDKPNQKTLPLKPINDPTSGYVMSISGTDKQYASDGWVDFVTDICHGDEGGEVCVGANLDASEAGNVVQCTRIIDKIEYRLISKTYSDVDPFCSKSSTPGPVQYEPKNFEDFSDKCLEKGELCVGVQTNGAVGEVTHVSHYADLLPPRGYEVVEQSVPSAKEDMTSGCFVLPPSEACLNKATRRDADAQSLVQPGVLQMGDKAMLPLAPYPRQWSSKKKGRGRLGRWGPNFAADPIVTRWNKETGNMEMAIIKRFDTGMFALPGGMVEPGDTVAMTVKKEFLEEAMGNPDAAEMLEFQKDKILKKLRGGHVKHLKDDDGEFKIDFDRKTGAFVGDEALANRALNAYVAFMQDNQKFIDLLEDCATWATTHHTVYTGMVDDPRNTDNAWMETQAVWIHCNSCPTTNLAEDDNIDDICTAAALTPATDATTATFKNVKEVLVDELYASHSYMVNDILLELQNAK